MRKIIVISMMTLDGVMQAPGGPEEDNSGSFAYGGWSAPYEDEVGNEIMKKLMQPADLLLGRKTFDIWKDYWPQHAEFWPNINTVTKYVLSTTINTSDWANTVFLNSLEDVEQLKNTSGSAIQVWGSSELMQSLLNNDLVDELWLIMYPLTLGQGKKLFRDGTIAAAFKLVESTTTPSGLLCAHYKRAGAVTTGVSGE